MFYKARFPQLFEYSVECPNELESCHTIKFILQPVVENCFKHAFRQTKSGGMIKISVRQYNGDILFTVWDNGTGIEKERLKEVNSKLEFSLDEEGIGIVNTNVRIRLVYGQQYGISLDSKVGQYTKIDIRIRKEG
ncbi:MAG: ATP-binding protein [Firmicutes bacterium]|nr:ATP-binding protein [Bacillota bacterium]